MRAKRLSSLFQGISVIILGLFLLVLLPSAADAKKPIRLKYATHSTDRHRQYSQGALVWLKKIEEASGGKVKITPYPSQTLCKGRDTWEAVKGGIADIGTAFVGFFPGRFPVTEVAFLPCLSMGVNSTAESSTRVIMEAYQKFPEMQAEYSDVKFLSLHSIEPAFLATRKKPVRQLEDLSGLKMRIAGVYTTAFMKAQGAVPMLMPPSAMYENMQKRVIDGYAYSWDGFMSRKMYEVTEYVLDAKWYVGAFFTVMNLKKWNSLPPDVQKAIESVTGVESAVLIGKQMDYDTGPALKKCSDRGIKVSKMSSSEQEKWKKAAKPIWDMWAKNAKAKGISGKRAQEIIAETMALYHKHAVK
jgi:TRAP-type transport system periplasmic protein